MSQGLKNGEGKKLVATTLILTEVVTFTGSYDRKREAMLHELNSYSSSITQFTSRLVTIESHSVSSCLTTRSHCYIEN